MISRVRNGTSWVLIFMIAGLIVGVFSSYRRPIWIDEFVLFAFGAIPTTTQVLKTAYETAVGVNHGQTMAYYIIAHFSIKNLGADYMVLRWPSLLAAFIMLLYATYFLREKGAQLNWQLTVLLAYASQVGLMYYGGEARSYMPLAAATVGVLCYYSIPLERRTRAASRLIGWSSVLIGVIMHPYFTLYWMVLVAFCYFTLAKKHILTYPHGRLWVFANPALLTVGFSLMITIGSFTWLRPRNKFEFDPFEGLRPSGGFLATLTQTHFQLLPTVSPTAQYSNLLATIVVAVIATSIAFAFRLAQKAKLRKELFDTLPPLLLIVLALAISSVLSLISMANSYWILPRQWVASLALIPLGFVWLLFEVNDFLRLANPPLARAFAVASIAFIMALGMNRLLNQWQVTQSEIKQFNTWQASVNEPKVRTQLQPISNEAWTILANNNVIVGGEVWPELARYYGIQEGVNQKLNP